jgi:hypothetical protein
MTQRFVQLVLDLLAPTVAPEFDKKKPSGLANQAPIAPVSIVKFRHPQANREVLLGDAVVAYALQRVRRRSIGFTVGADGLAVRAPTWVTLSAVDAALREKSGWILRKLNESRERQQRIEGGRIAWGHGAQLPYLGEALTVVLDPTHGFTGKGGALHSGSEDAGGPSLRIGLPHSASPAQIRDAVQAWLMRDARRISPPGSTISRHCLMCAGPACACPAPRPAGAVPRPTAPSA